MGSIKVSAAVRITVTYVVVASLWIIGSDRLAALIDPGALWLQSFKGLLFVATTAALLYGLIQADHVAREQAETKVREQAHLLEQTSDAIISTDMAYNVKTFSAGAERMYGWRAEEVIGKPLSEFVKTEYFDTTREETIRSLNQTGAWRGEISQLRKDGRRLHIQSVASILTNLAGERIGLISVNRDITEQRRLEEEQRLTQFSVDHASIGIMRTGVDAQILSVNEHYCKLSGYTAAELIGMHVYDIDPDFPLEKWKEHRSGLREAGADAFETQHKRKDGTLLPVEVTTTFVTFRGEEFSLSFIQDISDRKQTELQLRESQEKFSTAFQSSPVAMVLSTVEGEYLEVNRAFCDLTGYSYEEALGKSSLELGLISLEASRAIRAAVEQSGGRLRNFEQEIHAKNGRMVYALLSLENVVLDGDLHRLSTLQDITERKLAEQRIQQQAEALTAATQAKAEAYSLLDTLMSTSPTGMAFIDDDLRFRRINATLAEVNGIPAADHLGHTVRELLPELAPTVEPLFRQVIETRQPIVNLEVQGETPLSPGVQRDWLASYYPVIAPDGGVLGVGLNVVEISERKRAEEAVRQSREQLDLFIEHAPVALAMFDRDMNYLAASQRWLADYGLEPQNLAGRSHYDIFPEITDEWKQYHRQGMQGETVQKDEDPFKRLDGSVQWLRWVIKPWYVRAGEVGGIIIMTEDVTQRKEAEQAMRDSEERFRTLVDLSPVALYVNRHGRIDFANSAFLKLVGASSPEQVVGRDPLDFFVPERHDEVRKRIRAEMEEQRIFYRVEDRILCCDRTTRDVEVTAARFVDREGEAIQVLLDDITERKLAENRVKKLNRVYAVLSSINATIVRVREPQELFELACEIAVEKGGFKMAWIGLTDPQTGKIEVASYGGAPAEFFQDMMAQIRAGLGDQMPMVSALSTGEPIIVNDVRSSPRMEPVRDLVSGAGVRSGAVFPLRISGDLRGVFSLYSSEVGFFDEEEVSLLAELTQDISFALDVHALETRRRAAEQKVRESQERLQSTLDHMMEGCQIIDYDWHYRYVNDAAVEHGQTERDKLLGRTMMEAYPGIDRTPLFETLRKCMAEHISERMINEFVYPDGSSRWFELSIQPVPEGLFILSTDISARKKAEDELRRLNVELEQRIVERTGQLRHIKERVEAIINNSPDAILLLDPSGLIDVGNPAFSQWFGHDRDAIRGHRLADLAAPESAGAVGEALKSVTSDLSTQRVEVQAQRTDGSLFDVVMALAPIREMDQLLGLVCSLQDISKRKEVERLKDAFVSNVSHELRTPITSIRLNQKLIHMNPDRESVYLERMEREVGRLNDLIEDLLRLSRLDAGRIELNLAPVDLNQLVDEHVGDRSPIAESRSLTLSADKQADLPLVEADGGLLGQALSVLLTNALNYTPAGGAVVLRTLSARRGRQTWAGFQVSDTGPGIPAGEMPHLFERFYRGKVGRDSGKSGTGLGLAIAGEIIARHHGEMEVANNPGPGATFSVWLPAKET